MTLHNALLGLIAETSVHAGSGRSTGVVDLPIQREGHSDWPCIFGSGVKGALRSFFKNNGMGGAGILEIVFGPEVAGKDGESNEFAGAIAISDARLLLLPVRSLTSHFKWVTCPDLLERLGRDAQRLGVSGLTMTAQRPMSNDQALVCNGAEGDLFLEEFRFTTAPLPEAKTVLAALARLIDRDNIEADLTEKLVVVSNDMFTFMARHATPVAAHVRLDESKTVAPGALWYEETLPPETVLYVGLNAFDARKRRNESDKLPFFTADRVLTAITAPFVGDRPFLQIGGNETVGMGWFRVRVLSTANDAAKGD